MRVVLNKWLTLDAMRSSGMSRYSSICRSISSGRSLRKLAGDGGVGPEGSFNVSGMFRLLKVSMEM